MSGNNQEKEVRRTREDDLEINGPLGWKLRANGRIVTMLVMFVVGFGAILYMVHEHDLKNENLLLAETTSRKQQVGTVIDLQTRQQETLDTLVYILSLDPAQRSTLKLDMPPSLRAKLLNQERAR